MRAEQYSPYFLAAVPKSNEGPALNMLLMFETFFPEVVMDKEKLNQVSEKGKDLFNKGKEKVSEGINKIKTSTGGGSKK